MKASVEAYITNIETEAEYRGSVYEQTVYIKTGNKIIRCFDGKNHISADDSEVDLILLGQMWGSKDISETYKCGVKQPDPVEGHSKWYCVLCGEIINMDVSDECLQKSYDNLLLVNVGVGTVLVTPNDELIEKISAGTVGRGSNVSIECSRLDIIGLNTGQ